MTTAEKKLTDAIASMSDTGLCDVIREVSGRYDTDRDARACILVRAAAMTELERRYAAQDAHRMMLEYDAMTPEEFEVIWGEQP